MISALVFVVVISMLLAGIGTLSLSHYSRVKVDADFSDALNVAEAGANYEFNKISKLSLSADPKGSTNGVTYPFGAGSFTVYVTNRDGTVWTPGSPLTLVSRGTLNGTSRTISVTGKPYTGGTGGDYEVYIVKTGIWQSKGHITGDIGTNGTLTGSDPVAVAGKVTLNGSAASANSSIVATSRVYAPNPIVWPTVHAIAAGNFPGGLPWLATHNDNSLCSTIHSNAISTGGGTISFPGKAGGANYYLTGFVVTGACTITVNNTLGPVNLWLGPDGAAGSFSGNPNFDFRSTVNVNTTVADPTKPFTVYDSTTGPFTIESDGTMFMNIYAYNVDGFGSYIGDVDFRSPTTLKGAVLANTIKFEAEGYILNNGSYFSAPGAGYYGYDDAWVELNPLK